MEFDWRKAIDRCSEKLCEIAARLIVMAGIQAGRTVETMPRHLYFSILRLLRPAEYAARRLIMAAACKLVVLGKATKTAAGPSSPLWGSEGRVETGGSAPVDLPRDAQQSGMANRVRGTAEPRPPHQLRLARDASKPAYPLPAGARTTPRKPLFALFDPFKPLTSPFLDPEEDEVSSGYEVRDAAPQWEPVDAASLCRRIRALADAMTELERHALRLARWRARRDAEVEAGIDFAKRRTRPWRWSPLRPGRPPGFRERPKTAIEEVLSEVDFLARDAWNTS